MGTVTEEEIYRIVMRVEGEDRVAKLSDEIRKEEKALADLTVKLKAVGATQEQILKAQSVYAQSIASLNRELSAAQKQIDAAGGSFQKMGQGLVQLGYAADDAQYGMKGLANNIQPLLMAFGVGAGLAGAIGLVVTATTVLTDKWGKLMDLMGMGRVKTQAEEMESLAKSTGRTAEQTARLEEFQRRQEALQSLKGGRPKAEIEQNRAVADAINEAGGEGRLTAGMTAARNTGAGGLNPLAEGYQEFLDAKKQFDNPAAFATRTAAGTAGNVAEVREKSRALMDAAREKNLAATKKQIEDLISKAATGDGQAYAALMGEVGKNPGMFPPDALRQLQKGTAQAVHGRRVEGLMDQVNSDIERTQGRGRAAAEDLKKRTLDWMADEDRVGGNLNNNVGRDIRRDQEGQRKRAQEKAQQLRDGGQMDPVRRAMMGVMAGGGTAGQVEARAVRMLMDQGLSIEEAQKQAKGLMRENAEAAQGDAQKAMAGAEASRRNSAVFGGGEYARAVQQGVGGKNTSEQQLRQLQLIANTLKQMLGQARNNGMTE